MGHSFISRFKLYWYLLLVVITFLIVQHGKILFILQIMTWIIYIIPLYIQNISFIYDFNWLFTVVKWLIWQSWLVIYFQFDNKLNKNTDIFCVPSFFKLLYIFCLICLVFYFWLYSKLYSLQTMYVSDNCLGKTCMRTWIFFVECITLKSVNNFERIQ